MTKRIITTAKDLINKQSITDEEVMTKRIITTAKYLINKQTITDENGVFFCCYNSFSHDVFVRYGRKSHD